MQGGNGKGHHPGLVCLFMNAIVYNGGNHEGMKIKSIFLRYFFCYLLLLIGPLLVLPFGIIFLIFFIPREIYRK